MAGAKKKELAVNSTLCCDNYTKSAWTLQTGPDGNQHSDKN